MFDPAPTVILPHLSVAELEALFAQWGEPKFRAKQVYRQIFVNLSTGPEAMTDLPARLRDRLTAEASMSSLRLEVIARGDNNLTQKALFRLPDNSPVESVLMVYPDRATVCVSTQSGCPMACIFCATGKLGFLHDLSAGQIVEQVLWAGRELSRLHAADANLPDHLTNVVFMGMGEPFNNFDNWWAAVERLHDPQGFNMGARSFTVSTVGLIPGILRLAKMPLPVNLAISLHAPDDALRTSMMPVNKRYPIAELIDAVRTYTDATSRRVSFEYVLLREKNDFPEQAETLARLLRGLLCHVNLIPWNPVPGAPLSRSGRQRVLDFQEVLQSRGIACTVRVERGADIAAACGQLAGAVNAAQAVPTPET